MFIFAQRVCLYYPESLTVQGTILSKWLRRKAAPAVVIATSYVRMQHSRYYAMNNNAGSKEVLMRGNIALVEGAIKAGCTAYFGYPITPQNEVTDHMSKRMPEEGRIFIQSESELAAINMVFGAALTGARAMTSSSSPGISLKQEGISYMAGAELPGLIVNIQRGGPGLGNISGAQGDYFQATRGGGHGDYRTLVLAPDSVQEMYEFPGLAFNIAEKYRIPALMLSDGVLGQMMEPMVMKDIEIIRATDMKDWVLDGAKERPARRVVSLLMKPGALEEHNYHLQQKYQQITEKEVRFEETNTEGANVILVGYGTSARICHKATVEARNAGMKVGLFRPITLFPFPYKRLNELASTVKGFVVVEMSLGQMVEDVRLAVEGKVPVHFYGRPAGGLPEIGKIIQEIRGMLQ